MKDVFVGLDVGSTGVRAGIVDSGGKLHREEYRKLPRYQPEPGAAEYDPEELWSLCRSALNDLVTKNSAEYNIKGIGLSVQRSTFCLVDKQSGKAVTPFYSWADTRAVPTVERMNRSLIWNVLRICTGIIAFITRSTFFKAVSMLVFTPVHSSCRLRWVYDTNPILYKRSKNNELFFATVDTWLLFKLTQQNVVATDVSCAASTSLYNHFNFAWNTLFCGLFNIPVNIFPRVEETAYNYGEWEPQKGPRIPIGALAGDQMASLFGNRCFSRGDVKITLGSGGFVTVSMGAKPRLSRRGLFPLLAWTLKGEHTYMLEGQVQAVGTLIDWVDKGLGLAATPQELDALAAACEGSGEVTILPTPHGIGFPHFYDRLKSAVFGLSLHSTKEEVAYALYEGIALAIKDILTGITKDTGTKINRVKVDGGVCRSQPLMQILSNVIGKEVYSAREPEMSTVGAALLSGIGLGQVDSTSVFTDKQIQTVFDEEHYIRYNPLKDNEYRVKLYRRWKRALRSLVKNHYKGLKR